MTSSHLVTFSSRLELNDERRSSVLGSGASCSMHVCMRPNNATAFEYAVSCDVSNMVSRCCCSCRHLESSICRCVVHRPMYHTVPPIAAAPARIGSLRCHNQLNIRDLALDIAALALMMILKPKH